MSPELRLALLGGCSVTVDNQPVSGLTSHKAQALLCYLAVTGRAYSRPALAGLLWPDIPEANARTNLRKELARLSQVLRPYLLIDRENVAIDPNANCWLDVKEFEALLDVQPHQQPSIEKLTAAVALYQGDFLEGFYVLNGPTLEEWALRQRGRLRERVLQALQTLADAYTQQEHRSQAITTIQQLLALEPWREEAHCQLMRLYAQGGQRGAALAQYEICRRIMRSELDVEPAPETVALAEAIQRGALASGAGHSPVTPHAGGAPLAVIPLAPPFLSLAHRRQLTAAPFVARERQLSTLQRFLDQALGGEGQIVFVAGEAGSGKTALIQEFIRRSLAQHPALVPVYGHCSAYQHISDPFLPFREIVGRLTGDIESQWMTGAMTRDHALRIWQLLPAAVQLLIDSSIELLDTFVPSVPLIRRVGAYLPDATTLLARLQQWQARAQAAEGGQRTEQSRIFAACTDFFTGLATHKPLLLVLEDLHWSDLASISLLFHLVRRLHSAGAEARILLVGSYRPEDVMTELTDAPDAGSRTQHPLSGVLHEFKRDYGDIWLELDQTSESESQHFIDHLIDVESNRLDKHFRHTLFRQTHGHALFTVELLRAMRERGDLQQDEEGQWIEGAHLEWRTLPAQVEGVIEKRIGLLAPSLHELLVVASVEGEEFTAQVVARVLERRERQVLQQLSQTLGRQHHLVRASSELQVGRQWLARYQFGHALIQQFVYDSLSAGEKRLLHGEIGAALVALYGDETDEIVVQLAHHFVQAAAWEQALRYLSLAGDKARRSYANQEAIAFYSQALAVSQQMERPPAPADLLPVYEGRGLVYMLLTETINAIADFQIMCRLARTCGDQQKEGEALCQLAFAHWNMFAEEHAPFAEQYSQEAFELAQQIGDQRILAKSMTSLGFMHQWRGNMPAAARRLEASLAISRRNGYRASVGQNLLWLSVQAHWQGDFHQAAQLGEEGLAVSRELSDGLQELFNLAFLGLSMGGVGNYRYAYALFQEGLLKAKERENRFFIGRFMNQLGWYYSEFGARSQALDYDLESLESGRVSGVSSVEISALINVGLDYLTLGHHAAARSYLEPTLERVQREAFGSHRWRWLMRLLIGLADLSCMTGDYEQALRFADAGFKEAQATGSQKYMAKGQALRGKILLALNQPAGGVLLQQASDLAIQLRSPGLIYPLSYELGQWQASQGREAAAAASYRQAEAAIESMAQTIDDAALQALFQQSAVVNAVRAGLANRG